MGKYRKDKITLGNVLKVVEALLTLADEEISIPGDKLKATFKLEWVKEDELRVSGKVEEKRKNPIQTSEKGITKDDLWTLTECIGKTLEISPSLDGTKKDSPEKKKQAVQDVLDCLTDLKLLEDKRPHGKNDKSGYWKFHLKLKHQTADKKDNLKVIKDKWADNIGSVPDLELATPTKKLIDWREICTNLLNEEAQRRQATGYGMGHEVDIYVPLGLVKPKQQPRRSGENPDSTQGMQQYQLQGENEIEKRYAYQDFLDRVIAKADKNLAIIGEPGAGKSTWLQQIVQYLRGIPPTPLTEGGLWLGFPIWIPLANLGDFTLEEYLLNRWLKDAFSLLEPTTAQKQALVDLFNSGKVWLLLDGVDEMKTANPLTKISESLTGWVNKARVVLTCRLNVWEANPNTLPKFDTYRTLCFEGEQVNDFISQWFEKKEKPELGKQLQEKLATAESARIFDLVKNPLRLSLLCKAWLLNPGILPTTQADLYQQFRDDFYVWKQEKFPTSLDERQELNRRFAKLAFRAIAENRPLHQSFVYLVLEQEWFELAEKLGWLNFVYRDIRTDEPIYAFFHLTFQEYFAALAVDDWDDFLPRNHVNFPVPGKEYSENLSFPRRRESTIPERKPQYRIFQPQWKQVILFWLGRGDVAVKEKEEFIEKLVNFNDGCGEWNFEEADRGFYEYRAYFLAAAGIAELGKEYSKAREIVNKIVEWSFGYFNNECQEQQMNFPRPLTEAAQAILRETHRSIVVETLIDWLTSPNEYTCNERTCLGVAHSLGKIAPGHSQAIDALMNLIHKSSIPGIRIEAVMALEEVVKKNQETIDLLISLCNNSDPTVSSIAAQCLGKIDPNYSKAELISVSVIVGSTSTSFQKSVKSGKVDPRNPEVIESLINEVRFSDNNNQQLDAVKNLGYTDPTDPDAIIKILIDLINNHHTDHKIRYEAIRSLGRISKNRCEGINFLINLIANSHYNLEIIQAAVGALQYIEINHQEVINALLNLISTSSEHSIRIGATRTLQRILQRHLSYLTILALKNCITVNINSKQDLDIYLCCYEVLWQCAENLPYPQFYHAWHGLTENSTLVQSLELAQLPKNLQTQLTETNLNQTVQVFYIDGSKFIGDNPAKAIYRQMTQQGGRKIDDKPKNMADLQDYWADLIDENDQPPVLIFYQDPNNGIPQDFSETFLDLLTRFDGIICLITDQTHPPLQTFSPQNPQLIHNIIVWLQRRILEM